MSSPDHHKITGCVRNESQTKVPGRFLLGSCSVLVGSCLVLVGSGRFLLGSCFSNRASEFIVLTVYNVSAIYICCYKL